MTTRKKRPVGRPRTAPPAGSTAAKIVAARKQAGLTTMELAVAIGVAPSTLYNWESGVGAPSLAALQAIAEACGRKDMSRLIGLM